MEKGIKFFYITFIVIGIVLIFLAVYLFIDTKKAIKNSIETTGTLEKLENTNNYVITFNSEEGNKINIYSLYNNILAMLSKETNFSVFYNKENPKDVRINSFVSLWGLPALTMLVE